MHYLICAGVLSSKIVNLLENYSFKNKKHRKCVGLKDTVLEGVNKYRLIQENANLEIFIGVYQINLLCVCYYNNHLIFNGKLKTNASKIRNLLKNKANYIDIYFTKCKVVAN